MNQAKQVEPPSKPSCPTHFHFLIGKDSRGNWVVQDKDGLCGGLFVDRNQALRFAMFENGNRPDAVIMVPGIFELNMHHKGIGARTFPAHSAPRQRVA